MIQSDEHIFQSRCFNHQVDFFMIEFGGETYPNPPILINNMTIRPLQLSLGGEPFPATGSTWEVIGAENPEGSGREIAKRLANEGRKDPPETTRTILEK